MAANRFVLVPEDIYRGLTSSAQTDTGDPNLDFARRSLENVKRQRTDSTTKNVHYNQELRRYLHLKKAYDEKPVKVAFEGGIPPTAAVQQQSQASTPRNRKRTITSSTNGNESFTNGEEEKTNSTVGSDDRNSMSTLRAETETSDDPQTPKQRKEWREELVRHFTANPVKYHVSSSGSIINQFGKPIANSSLRKSLDWIYSTKGGGGRWR